MKTQYQSNLTQIRKGLFACILGFTALVSNSAYSLERYDSLDSENQYYSDYDADGHYQELLSQPKLAQLLAPIALYPDTLLSHILIASTNPVQIVQAYRWQQEHAYLSKRKLSRKASKKDWSPSIIALVAFPDILERMNDDLEWTQALGQAFLQSESRVLASIQHLRREAKLADSFSGMENLSVSYVDQQIIIEPRYREVIYVPYYDPRVVYGHWRWHSHPPVYWHHKPSTSIHIELGHSHRFGWSKGVHINFNYFFSTFHWRKKHVVVTSHHNSHYYRPKHRIITSHGAKRWHGKSHRHSTTAGYRNGNRTSYSYKQDTRVKVKPHHKVNRSVKVSHSADKKVQYKTITRTVKKAKFKHNKQANINARYKQPHSKHKASHYKPPAAQVREVKHRGTRAQPRSAHDGRQKIK